MIGGGAGGVPRTAAAHSSSTQTTATRPIGCESRFRCRHEGLLHALLRCCAASGRGAPGSQLPPPRPPLRTCQPVARAVRPDPLGISTPLTPLSAAKPDWLAELRLSPSATVKAHSARGVPQTTTVGALDAHLASCYCDTVSVEYDHIQSAEQREWLEEQVETAQGPAVPPEHRREAALLMRRSEGRAHFFSHPVSSLTGVGCSA